MGWGPISGLKDNIVDVARDGAKGFQDAVDYAKKNVSVSDVGHAALDVVGLVPVVGEAADLANAGWYAAEGNYADAALSAAGAIPFAGWGAAAVKGAKYGTKAVDAGRAVMKTGDEVAEAGATASKGADDAAAAGKAPETQAGDAGGPVDPPGGGKKTAGGADEPDPVQPGRGSSKDADEPIAANPGKIDEGASRFRPKEREIAQWYADRGYDVQSVPRKPGEKTPDAIITRDGVSKAAEFKTVETPRSETIVSKATKGSKQSGEGGNITIDTRTAGTSEDAAREALDRLSNSDKLPVGSTVTVLGDGFALTMTR